MLDVDKIRQDFPMIQHHPELIYFDNAATSLKPQCVIDAVMDFYTEHTSNVHRGDYEIAAENDRLYDGTRNSIAKLIHCEPKEVVYTHNVTQSMNQIVFGLGKGYLKKGDTVLLSKAEHASNLLPWFNLQKERGIIIEYIPTDEEACIHMDAFRKATASRGEGSLSSPGNQCAWFGAADQRDDGSSAPVRRIDDR
jgi:cysteine desulfurase/selenocysteine lyase